MIVDADNVAPCAIDSIVITEPEMLVVLNENAISPSCANVADGAIELAVTGGTPTIEGNYNFARLLDDKWDLQVGGSYRSYSLNNKRIYNSNYMKEKYRNKSWNFSWNYY